MEISVVTARRSGRSHDVAGNDLKTMEISDDEYATLFNAPGSSRRWFTGGYEASA